MTAYGRYYKIIKVILFTLACRLVINLGDCRAQTADEILKEFLKATPDADAADLMDAIAFAEKSASVIEPQCVPFKDHKCGDIKPDCQEAVDGKNPCPVKEKKCADGSSVKCQGSPTCTGYYVPNDAKGEACMEIVCGTPQCDDCPQHSCECEDEDPECDCKDPEDTYCATYPDRCPSDIPPSGENP